MQLTEHFHIDEFLVSETAARAGIEFPEPPAAVRDNLARLCEQVLEPLRVIVERPVIVTSGWRPSRINELVGGSPNSQHIEGQAADIIVPGIPPWVVATWLKNHNSAFDQLINEFGRWVHVSVPAKGAERRSQVLTAQKAGGKTAYLQGLV